MRVKFPYCCSSLQQAHEVNMVCIESNRGEISWFDGQMFVIRVKKCPFCGKSQDDSIIIDK
jgi:hypothetical protein